MNKKTISELENEILLNKTIQIERDVSNNKYALKWVEKILFWAGAIIVGAVVTAVMKVVLKI